MARTRESETVDNLNLIEQSEGLYWFGILPATELLELPIPTQTRDPQTREFYKLEKFTPHDLWSANSGLQEGGDKFPIFAGKQRQFQSLAVRGFVFPAYSQAVEAHGQDISRIPFPGGAMVMTAERADEVIASTFRFFIRFIAGTVRRNKFSCAAEVWDMDLGCKPPAMTDEQWARYRLEKPVNTCPKFNSRTDMLVSEFVYLQRVPGSEWTEWDPAEYIRNPNKFHQRAVPMQFDKKFFTKPPQSIAEMYPRG